MDEDLEQSGSLPELSEIKGIVRRRRWQFLIPFFCGWFLVWGASWLIPSTYRSGTLILVEQPSVPEKYVESNIDSDIQHQRATESISREGIKQRSEQLRAHIEETKKRLGIEQQKADSTEQWRKDRVTEDQRAHKEREAAAPMRWNGSMDIQTLKSLYTKGIITPEDVINEVYKRLKLPTADSAVWLHIFPHAETVKRARDLLKAYPDASTRHPLFGIPFSIKDSIDIKGIPTTAACPAYAYVAEKDSPSYAALIEAGCIAIGKVNLVCS